MTNPTTGPEAPYPELLTIFHQLKPGSKVLDMGCGEGRNALYLAKAGHRVIAIDSDAAAIAALNAQAAAGGLTLTTQIADILDPLEGGPFDLILLDRVLHYLSDAGAVFASLSDLHDSLAPGGILCVVAPTAGDDTLGTLGDYLAGAGAEDAEYLYQGPVTHHSPPAGTFQYHAVVVRTAAS